jgi:signal transduction histidine kinase
VGQPDHDDVLVIHAPIATYEAALWRAVLWAVRPCLSQARLQAEVLVQLAAVQRSRNRIVEASDAERRRIERNLHDGAQQRLVSLALRMRTEQRRHAPTLGPEAMRIIDAAVQELRGSVEDLRALAAGLLPGSLVSEGLGPALQEMALRHPHGVRVLNTLDHRHSQSVEEVAWFVAAEGVANAVKHASQARVSIEVGCAEASLTLLVRDDGPGGAVEGAGLTGLQDRVRACSGALDLHSPSGDGTTLRVVVPCA